MIDVRAELEKISSQPETDLNEFCYEDLSDELKSFVQTQGLDIYHGKVREVLLGKDHVYILHSDRLSAFDRFIGNVPFKGAILNEINCFWLKQAASIISTHYIDKPHGRILKAKRATPYKVEVIVRGYLAGSMLRSYEKGERDFCGNTLPEGLTAYGALPETIITPTTKAEAYEHDLPISAKEVIEQNLCTQEEWDKITKASLDLFAQGQRIYNKLGWILVDTKYEFGKDNDGNIILIDELHTPDSSRLWVKETYEQKVSQGQSPEMLDKENVRRYLANKGFMGEGEVPSVPATELVNLSMTYLRVAEALLGKKLELSPDNINSKEVLQRYLAN